MFSCLPEFFLRSISRLTAEPSRSLALNTRTFSVGFAMLNRDSKNATKPTDNSFTSQVPSTAAEWEKVIQEFESCWQFPNACGAMDGKHISIRCPANSGSEFFNYKKTFSIILFAVADAHYNFLYIDVGTNGRANDAAVFSNSDFSRALQNEALGIPARGVFVGDDAFPLRTDLLKPFSRCGQLDQRKRIFNYRLSRARRVVENAFGLLVARFRIFETPIPLSVATTEQVVKTACALHNWLRKTSTSTPIRVPTEGHGAAAQGPAAGYGGFQPLPRSRATNPSREATRVREVYADRFMTTDALPWQWTL